MLPPVYPWNHLLRDVLWMWVCCLLCILIIFSLRCSVTVCMLSRVLILIIFSLRCSVTVSMLSRVLILIIFSLRCSVTECILPRVLVLIIPSLRCSVTVCTVYASSCSGPYYILLRDVMWLCVCCLLCMLIIFSFEMFCDCVYAASCVSF